MSEWTVTSDFAFLVSGSTPCWKCKRTTRVWAVHCVEAVTEDFDIDQICLSDIRSCSDNLAALFARSTNIKLAHSKTADSRYFANHCQHCGVIQGDFFLHSEPGAVFFPTDSDGMKALDFTEIEGSIEAECTYSSGSMENAYTLWEDSQWDEIERDAS